MPCLAVQRNPDTICTLSVFLAMLQGMSRLQAWHLSIPMKMMGSLMNDAGMQGTGLFSNDRLRVCHEGACEIQQQVLIIAA